MKVKVYNKSGKSETTITVADDIFGKKWNDQLMAQAIRVFLANRKPAMANTLGRGEVRGGGRKPWRQKGTGRARVGSNRSPIWRGGGITFGPTLLRNRSLAIPKKMRLGARNIALSQKVTEKMLFAVKGIEKIYRKELVTLLEKLDILGKRILLVTEKNQTSLIRTARNMVGITVIGRDSLNTYDLLSNHAVLASEDVVKSIK